MPLVPKIDDGTYAASKKISVKTRFEVPLLERFYSPVNRYRKNICLIFDKIIGRSASYCSATKS